MGNRRTGSHDGINFRLILAALAGFAAAFVLARALRRLRATPSIASRDQERFRGFSLDSVAPVYDSFTSLFGFGPAFRLKTVELAGIKPGERVLDVGCGTGGLTLYVKDAVGPTGQVAGIDIAPKMLETAIRKAANAGKEISFQVASVESLPFSDGSFDVVTSSLMVHHLPTEVKRTGLAEIFRVLKPGGRLLVVDFGPASPVFILATRILARLLFFLLELHYGQDNFKGMIPDLIREAGFSTVEVVGKREFLGASLEFVLACKPSSPGPDRL